MFVYGGGSGGCYSGGSVVVTGGSDGCYGGSGSC